MELNEKLEILSGAAKYDVSCSSSGTSRKGEKGQLGSASKSGICHTFTPDGRCVSLLKVLLTNHCIYDCMYCINRASNQVPRAAFTPSELIDLTLNFYRRNYIEGLFLSSGILKNPDYTMERLTLIVKSLRQDHGFKGYIHVKAIPGSNPLLINECGLYADRMSVNIELPSSPSLKLLAPQKEKSSIFTPMAFIHQKINEHQENRKTSKKAPSFVSAGQSTQMIIGASPETDFQILKLSEGLYHKYGLKRVYYSAYIPVNEGKHLPAIQSSPPLLREHRLYQSDWLLRYYQFKADEILDPAHPHLDINFDPKTNWALNHLDDFPLEVNTAPFESLIRIPGIGIKGARKIMSARHLGPLTFEDLKKLKITLKRAQYFVLCQGKYYGSSPFDDLAIRKALSPSLDLNQVEPRYTQLNLFDEPSHQCFDNTNSSKASSSKMNPSNIINPSNIHSVKITPQLLPDASTVLTGEF